MFFGIMFFGGSGETVVCPNLVGKTWTEVQSNEQYKDFNIEKQEANNTEYEAGVIFKQTPPADKNIKEKMKRLDEIVKIMSDNKLPLEETINIFEEGQKLIKELKEQLTKAEEKVIQEVK